MIDCEAVMRQLWDYLDGELTPSRADAIRAHLSACARCFPHVEFEEKFLAALASARRSVSDPDELRERVVASLRAEGLTGI